MELRAFTEAWNKGHARVLFHLDWCTIEQRALPVRVAIRYNATAYKYGFDGKWGELNEMIAIKSHGLMFVTSNEEMFARGIISAEIASCNFNYKQRFVVETLRWIGKIFLPSMETKQDSTHLPTDIIV